MYANAQYTSPPYALQSKRPLQEKSNSSRARRTAMSHDCVTVSHGHAFDVSAMDSGPWTPPRRTCTISSTTGLVGSIVMTIPFLCKPVLFDICGAHPESVRRIDSDSLEHGLSRTTGTPSSDQLSSSLPTFSGLHSVTAHSSLIASIPTGRSQSHTIASVLYKRPARFTTSSPDEGVLLVLLRMQSEDTSVREVLDAEVPVTGVAAVESILSEEILPRSGKERTQDPSSCQRRFQPYPSPCGRWGR